MKAHYIVLNFQMLSRALHTDFTHGLFKFKTCQFPYKISQSLYIINSLSQNIGNCSWHLGAMEGRLVNMEIQKVKNEKEGGDQYQVMHNMHCCVF